MSEEGIWPAVTTHWGHWDTVLRKAKHIPDLVGWFSFWLCCESLITAPTGNPSGEKHQV